MTIPSLDGRSILIIEDEALIALDLTQAFEKAGANVTTTSTLPHAQLLVKQDDLSAAVVDHALADGDTDDICSDLRERGVPFVVYSGFDSSVVQEGIEALYVSKPNTPELVVAAIEQLLQTGASHAPNEDEGAMT